MSHSRSWSRIWNKQSFILWHEKESFIVQVSRKFSSAAPIEFPLLDVGCGRGAFIQHLKNKNGLQCFGVDFVSNIHRAIESTDYVTADCGKLPIKSNKFSSITGILLIEHVPNYYQFLIEAERVLKPGGLIYLLFPNFFSLVTPALFIRRRILKIKNIPHHKPLRLKTLMSELQSLKLDIIAVEFMSIIQFKYKFENIGRVLDKIIPNRFKEEIILVAKKRVQHPNE